MLGLHPRISPIYETDFVVQLANLLTRIDEGTPDQVRRILDQWTRPLPRRPDNKRPHERYHHGAHYILFDRSFAMARVDDLVHAISTGQAVDGLRTFISELFAEHCRIDNKPNWANKTPAYVHHLPLLEQLFPGMRFLHCVRDGRDVATSVMTRPWGPKTVADAAQWWAEKVRDGVTFCDQHPHQGYTVRFEELIEQPARSLARLLDWLGEDPAVDQMLACYRDATVRLDSGRIGEWQRTISSSDVDAFHSRAGDLLDRLGYR